MQHPAKQKGKGWIITLAIIGLIRLAAAWEERFSDSHTDSSYSVEKEDQEVKDVDGVELAYSDRKYSKRDKDDDAEPVRQKKTDSRTRTEDDNEPGARKSGTRTYTIVMPGDGASTRVYYEWSYKDAALKKKEYELVMQLLKSVIRQEQEVLEDLESSTLEELGIDPGLQKVSEIRFQLALWKAAYSRMYKASLDHFDPLISGLNEVFKKEAFTTKEKLDFLISFVQNIRYERPGGELDVLPPMVTLSRRYGDCDTKSLLLYVLLEKFGYDCSIMWSQHYQHAMLGLYTRASGDYKEQSGRKYYFVETTYPEWMIGQLPPKWNNTSYWYTIKL